VEAQELRTWLLAIAAQIATLGVAAASASPVGHYYLEGVRETGSELSLKPDGRYDWYMTYGAMDIFSTGAWQKKGNSIILAADKPDSKTSVFKLGPLQPWNEDAEELAQRPAYQAAVEATYARCPFMIGEADSVTPPAMVGLAPDPAAKLKAEAAAQAAIAARTLYERFAINSLKITGDRSASVKAAGDARRAWTLARYAMQDAYSAAQLSAPRLEDPKLPDACRLPSEPNPADIAPEKWIRGFAVLVSDPDVGMTYSGIIVVFDYGDGSASKGVVTDGGGLAISPDRKAITRISLSLRGSNPRMASFDTKPITEGMQAVTLDSRKITDPPFQTMTLRIEARDLIPENGRGRYARH
jgi:hypothetical protein